MAHLEARKHISPDSGFPVTLHPNFSPKIKDWVPPEAARAEMTPPRDRAHFADPDKKALLAPPGGGVTRTDLTESLGTVLAGVQLARLGPAQLDELALLVSERGVVFFRGQEDLTTERQVALFGHYGVLDRHPAQRDAQFVTIRGSREDHRELLAYTPWPSGDFHADTSFEANPPSYAMLRMEEHPAVGGDTAWVSGYGLYDTLSEAMKRFVSGLHAVHTSRLQYDTILDLWGTGPNRPPVDSHHPAVRTHPVTGLRALNVNPGFVTGFAELKKAESDKLMDFFAYHIHSADDHAVRWKWEVGSVAMWDNRCVLHRVIPGRYEGSRKGIRTTVFGEKRAYNNPRPISDTLPFMSKLTKNDHVSAYFDPASEGRYEREERLQNQGDEKWKEPNGIKEG